MAPERVALAPSRTGGAAGTATERDTLLTGWGRTAPTRARLIAPGSAQEVADLLAHPRGRGVIGRGLGRSYGDAAQSAGGVVVASDRLTDLEFDPADGTVVAGAGCSVDGLLRELIPRGWFVPVTPGTRYVSMGGAVAADVHGKNHHRDGSLGRHLRWLELVDGTGRLLRLSPDGDDPDAFWATVGGMGLTGVITRVALQAIPVDSAYMRVQTERADDLDALMDRLREHDRQFRYTVAWIDLVARGRATGRGVITSGDHAGADELGGGHPDARTFGPTPRLAVPVIPLGLVNSWSVRAFNEAWFRKAPKLRADELQRVESFFHPLDGVRDWNRLYGPAGFLQYQVVVPDGAEDVLRGLIELLAAAGASAFLAVLKRFGPGNPGPLSFPTPGWTLALDVPAVGTRLARALDVLDERVAQAGGRVYLAKDSRLRPELLPAMYPRLPAFLEARRRLDPDRRFSSDLSVRLGL